MDTVVSEIWAGKAVYASGDREHMFSVREGSILVVHKFPSKDRAEAARAKLLAKPRVPTDAQDRGLVDLVANENIDAAACTLLEDGQLLVTADTGGEWLIDAKTGFYEARA